MSEKIQQLLKTIEIYHISSNTFEFIKQGVSCAVCVKNFVLIIIRIKI